MTPAVREESRVKSMDKKPSALPQSSVGGGESPLAVHSSGRGSAVAPPPASNAETAHRLFTAEVARLPGVLRVEPWGEEGSASPTFYIYLRPEDRDTEYAVYEVKGQVYDRFPEAYLDVVVLEASDGPAPNDEPGT